MDVKKGIIEKLESSRGEYISGEALADALGVTRNAVWKAITALREEGYDIDAVKNRGYSLNMDSNVLSPQGISKYMESGFYNISVVKTVDSTNNAVKAMAEEGKPEGTVLVAEQQTSGKGRRGRSFLSPPWEGVYFSILLRPKMGVSGNITAAAAVAVSDAVEAVTGKKCGIKWVNDVFLNGKKICGILTEASVDMESGGLEYAVLGIGVNVAVDENKLPENLRGIVGGIAESCRGDIRSRLIAKILDAFLYYYKNLEAKTFLEAYRARSIVTGRHIYVIRPDITKPAFAEGIDEECRLVVRYENWEREAISSGEVSIRTTGGTK